MILHDCDQIEADIIEMMEKALRYADVIVSCSSTHLQLAVQYRTAKIHHRLASLYHNALRNDVRFILCLLTFVSHKRVDFALSSVINQLSVVFLSVVRYCY